MELTCFICRKKSEVTDVKQDDILAFCSDDCFVKWEKGGRKMERIYEFTMMGKEEFEEYFDSEEEAQKFFDEEPCGPYPFISGLKSKIIFIIDEIKNMGMRPCEFVFRLLAEGVVPDEPVTHKKAKLIGYDFYIGSVFIANSYIE